MATIIAWLIPFKTCSNADIYGVVICFGKYIVLDKYFRERLPKLVIFFLSENIEIVVELGTSLSSLISQKIRD